MHLVKNSICIIFIMLISSMSWCQTPAQRAAALVGHNEATLQFSTLQDLYKSAFQDRFGPGHIVRNREACKRNIDEEIAEFDSLGGPDWQFTGIEGNYVRVNVRLLRDGNLDKDLFVDALMEGVRPLNPITQTEWKTIWEQTVPELLHIDSDYQPLNYVQDSVAIAKMLAAGEYVMHHTMTFNKAYNFHYRLIRKDIFFKRILPAIGVR